MGMFDGLGETELYERGVYLTPGGVYELEVKKVLLKETRKSGLGFIVEFTVLSAEGAGEAQHAPGSRATWFQKMTDKDVAFPALKQFLVGLLGINMNNPEEKEEFNSKVEEILEAAVTWEPEDPEDETEEHPWAGFKVCCETFSKVTKKGADFTSHIWSESQHEEAA
jgi:hypothetical protein